MGIEMKKIKLMIFFAMSCIFVAGVTNAGVTEDDFKAKTTQNLINLCTASQEDPNHAAAIHFCQGYLVGAYHFHNAQVLDDPTKALTCFPEPKPSRNEAIAEFVSWALKHPEHMGEVPVDTEFRFLAEQYPCKK
jgi:Rap1a immunity proteins